jgi:pilus assembly protein CpaC
VSLYITTTVLALLIGQVPGPPEIEREIVATRTIELEVGQSRLLEITTVIGRASIANPEIADIKAITPQQIHVIATAIGETNLSVWDKSDRVNVFQIRITRSLATIREQLAKLFPGEALEVTSAGDLVILSGEVSDVRLPQRAVEVVSLHATRVANLIKVRGNQQAQLSVRFAEVSRTGLRRLGNNFYHQDANRVGGIFSPETVPGNVIPGSPQIIPPSIPGTGLPSSGLPPQIFQAPHSDAFNLFFSNLPGFGFSAILSLLQSNGLAKVLAEPTLISLSGQEAKFLAGGEVPIPVVSTLGQTSVIFKKFGIQLAFTPTVLADETVNLKLSSEVSEIDYAAGINIGGFLIPGFSSRQSETTVRLSDGESFAIAGLLSDKTRTAMRKVPLLGEIPILGMLFRSTSFQREETELLIVITVHLVRPLAPHEVPSMPGESEVNDPDDFELFLLGRTSRGWGEDEPIHERSKRGGGPAGEVGFGR